MAILVTGVAGFIGFHCAQALLARGEQVIGVDCFLPYYRLDLKEARVAALIESRSNRSSTAVADSSAVTASSTPSDQPPAVLPLTFAAP